MPNENVRYITSGMGREIGAALVKAVPDDVPFEVGKAWIGDQAMVAMRVRDMLIPPQKPEVVPFGGDDFAVKLAGQENFWRRLFPMEDFGFDPAEMLVWQRRPGRNRLIVTPIGLWGNPVYDKYAERKIPTWRWTENLDAMVNLSGTPYMATARWFRDRQEADEELLNKSALDLEAMLIPGITLVERLVYGLVFWEEKELHLDTKTGTFCTGSRNPGGNVPRVSFDGGRVRVGAGDPAAHRPVWRSRAAA